MIRNGHINLKHIIVHYRQEKKIETPRTSKRGVLSSTVGDTSKKINIGTSNADYPTATAITNFEHEQEQQDKKRKIKLLDPSFVPSFVGEFKSIMKESII